MFWWWFGTIEREDGGVGIEYLIVFLYRDYFEVCYKLLFQVLFYFFYSARNSFWASHHSLGSFEVMLLFQYCVECVVLNNNSVILLFLLPLLQ